MYKAQLDVERIKNGELDGIEYPELEETPESIKRLLAKPIGSYPKGEEQDEWACCCLAIGRTTALW